MWLVVYIMWSVNAVKVCPLKFCKTGEFFSFAIYGIFFLPFPNRSFMSHNFKVNGNLTTDRSLYRNTSAQELHNTELQKRCPFSQSALNKQLVHLISTWFAVRCRADLVSAGSELSVEARRQQQSHGASGSVGNRRFPNCAISQSPTKHSRLYNPPKNATFPSTLVIKTYISLPFILDVLIWKIIYFLCLAYSFSSLQVYASWDLGSLDPWTLQLTP